MGKNIPELIKERIKKAKERTKNFFGNLTRPIRILNYDMLAPDDARFSIVMEELSHAVGVKPSKVRQIVLDEGDSAIRAIFDYIIYRVDKEASDVKNRTNIRNSIRTIANIGTNEEGCVTIGVARELNPEEHLVEYISSVIYGDADKIESVATHYIDATETVIMEEPVPEANLIGLGDYKPVQWDQYPALGEAGGTMFYCRYSEVTYSESAEDDRYLDRSYKVIIPRSLSRMERLEKNCTPATFIDVMQDKKNCLVKYVSLDNKYFDKFYSIIRKEVPYGNCIETSKDTPILNDMMYRIPKDSLDDYVKNNFDAEAQEHIKMDAFGRIKTLPDTLAVGNIFVERVAEPAIRAQYPDITDSNN